MRDFHEYNKARKNKLYRPIAKLPRAFVFWCAFDLAKFKLLIFLLAFVSRFLWTYLSKYRWKDMTDTIKQFEQQTSWTLCSVLYLVHPKIKFHISYWTKLWPTQKKKKVNKKVKKKKKKKKNAVRSGFPEPYTKHAKRLPAWWVSWLDGFRDVPAYCLNLYIVLCIIISATYKSHIILLKKYKTKQNF